MYLIINKLQRHEGALSDVRGILFSNWDLRLRLFTLIFFLLLYKAFKSTEQFVGHVSGILGNVESRARVYGSEVRVVGAIVAPSDGDVHKKRSARRDASLAKNYTN